MVPAGLADVAPWRDWAAAADGVLRFLHEHVGWDLWMVTRVEGGHQIVLAAWPDGMVRPGARLPWVESFCWAMVEGSAPRVATVTAAVPEYASRTRGLGRDVAAYMGVPLVHPASELFGTICGFSFPRQAAERDARPPAAGGHGPDAQHPARRRHGSPAGARPPMTI